MNPVVAAAPAVDPDVALTREFLGRLLPRPRDFAIRLWDGTVLEADDDPRFTLVLRSPGAIRRIFRLPIEVGLGEGFIYGDYDIEGDVCAAFGLVGRVRGSVRSPADVLALVRLRRQLPTDSAAPGGDGRGPVRLSGSRHTRDRDRAAIQYHYDVSNEFYRLWLDERMVYSCGYYPTGSEDLDTAQERKLDHICRKLRLERGERMLDIGCGWGALSIHAAQNYGVRVLGVTLSERQHEFANRRVRELGLEDRVTIKLLDYRDIAGEPFDKIASIAMFEAVGRVADEYFAKVHRLLKSGGLFLNHSIAAHPKAEAWTTQPPVQRLYGRVILGRGQMRERYVFPDGKLIPLSEANLLAERAGFEVRDVENLREHYIITLREWLSRLEDRREDALEIVSDSVYRTWRLYLAASILEFENANININQTLFAKLAEGVQSVPLSRADLYE